MRDAGLTINTFKKCDMHVHSSSCFSRRYDKATFFRAVLKSELDVLAITDHNSIDVELLTDLQNQMKGKGKVLFGGVEIDVMLKDETIKAYGLETGGKGRFHAIVWMTAKLKKYKIWNCLIVNRSPKQRKQLRSISKNFKKGQRRYRISLFHMRIKTRVCQSTYQIGRKRTWIIKTGCFITAMQWRLKAVKRVGNIYRTA